MKKFFTFLLVIVFMLAFSNVAFAGVGSGEGGYPSGPIQKAERGFGNAVFGWTEIPKSVVEKTRETNPVKGLLLGVFQGTFKAFARTVSGVADLATFPIGGYDEPAILPDMPAVEQ